jgi:hypothetical protein
MSGEPAEFFTRAIQERHFPHPVKHIKMVFLDDEIRVFDLEGHPLRKIRYSDVRKCYFDSPHVEGVGGAGIMGIGAPAAMSPAVLKIEAQCEEAVEKFVVTQATSEMTADDIRKLFGFIEGKRRVRDDSPNLRRLRDG